MRLFIQIRDGQPYEHPIFEDNFIMAFPHIDVNNLPSEFALFERIENPRVAKLVYEPPIPRPETGIYFWQWTTSSWVEEPQRPDDGKEYRLDFASATWVEITP